MVVVYLFDLDLLQRNFIQWQMNYVNVSCYYAKKK